MVRMKTNSFLLNGHISWVIFYIKLNVYLYIKLEKMFRIYNVIYLFFQLSAAVKIL